MKIEEYSFGRIVINGKTYTSDVIIFPDRVKGGWWRKEGHCLYIEDLKEVIEEKPEVLVVGTGAYGAMRVPKETLEELKRHGIEVIVCETKEACKIFNELSGKKRVVAALHLTC
ncbi:MAG: Mth938-like domain-containing protein [Candidatus Baldrarchaeia archaeon]